MKNIKKLLFSFIAICLFLTGFKVEAKTVTWDDLVSKLNNGKVVEEITNEKNNGENQDIDITSDASKFKAVMSIDGNQATFILNYSNGVVSFDDNSAVNTVEDANFARLLNLWVEDVIKFVGDLYNFDPSEVADLIASSNLDSYNLANNGIEVVKASYNYTYGSDNFNGEKITSFKLDLVNGFGGLTEIVDPDCLTPDVPKVPETPETKPESAQVTEEVKNPSTGDIEVYQIVGGIAVCMAIAIGAAIHLRKKEEII